MASAGITASAVPNSSTTLGRICWAASPIKKSRAMVTAYTDVPQNIPFRAALGVLAAKARCHISAPAMVKTR